MSTNQDHAHRLREMSALATRHGIATFGTAYQRALEAAFELFASALSERDTDMDTSQNATHARHIRQALDDLRAGRPLNTGGDVQAALEAAATQLEKRDVTNPSSREIIAEMQSAAASEPSKGEQNPPNHVHPPAETPATRELGHAPGVVAPSGTVSAEPSISPAPAPAPDQKARHK